MNNFRSAETRRIDDLLVDQATGDLGQEQEAELRALLKGDIDLEQNPFMETAALIQLGMESIERTQHQNTQAAMPHQLRAKLAAAAMQSSATVTQLHPTTKPAPSKRWEVRDLGWALAAAFAVALVVVNVQQTPTNPAALRSELLAKATDMRVIPWSPSAEPDYANVSGDVSWSDALQEGYMRLAGLPANDPTIAQYQLWIIDPDRSAQPVDGGVFDIPADGGEFIVPITAKLKVSQPTAFAITLEQPGGVVVSAGPLLIVAAAES